MAERKSARGPSLLGQVPWGKIVYIGGTVGFFVLAIASAFQAWQVSQSASRRATLELEARRLAEQVGSLIEERQLALRKASGQPLLDPLLNAESSDEVTVLDALRRQLPGSSELKLLLGADISAILAGDHTRIGFVRTEMLRVGVQSAQAPPAQLVLGGKPTLVLAEPIKRGVTIQGFLIAEWPTKALTELIDQSEARHGALELRLQSTYVASVAVQRKVDAIVSEEDYQQIPVPGSRLAVAYGVSRLLPFPLGSNLSTLLLMMLGGLLGGIAMVARERLQDTVAGIRAKMSKTVVEPTMAEQLAAERGTTAPVAGGPAAAATSGGGQEATPSPANKSVATAPPAAPATSAAPARATLDRSIFRAYDIRGVVGSSLSPGIAELIGMAVGSEIVASKRHDVCVACDGRHSGPELKQALIRGLRATGVDVIDVGAVPTPVLYYAAHEVGTGSGVMVTGSHNPPEYNGFKVMVAGETLSTERIQELYARIAENRFARGNGALRQTDVVDRYIDRISGDVQLESPLRVILDAGNGIAGGIAPQLFEAIGCDVTPLYCEVDGSFPNHHPDPSDPRNLSDLAMSVKQTRADLGLAFDGDGDRLGVVTSTGEIIHPDKLLMLYAQDVLTRNPGGTVIYDVKCSGTLANVIRGAGGVPVMWRTGHSLIKAKMIEMEAQLAGEMSGHFFFKERWYGFDDGLYAGCRLLEAIAASGLSLEDLLADLPKMVSTPELKIQVAEGEQFRFIARLQAKAKFDGARVTDLDGIRADWDDGFGLIRASNTTPILVLRFEGKNDAALLRIQDAFRQQILAVDPKLSLPF